MDYERVYYALINRAIRETHIGKRVKNYSCYYEYHHIIPKSLGGGDCDSNLVMLTAKEHYVCHLLLTKKFNPGTMEFAKMLCAFKCMCVSYKHSRMIKNARQFKLYREHFSSVMSILQSGDKNSQYGKKWYTNYITGLSKRFSEPPSTEWVLGRNCFSGQYESVNRFCKKRSAHRMLHASLQTIRAQKIWDDYHSSSCNGMRDYQCSNGIEGQLISKLFAKYIPIYTELKNKRHTKLLPNKDFVGKYE